MASWNSIKWLVWIALYVTPAIFLPWAISRSWVQQRGGTAQFSPKQLFERGELGLLGMILSSGVIWHLLQSQFMTHTIAVGSVLLALSGIMAATVWVETYCRQYSGTDRHPARGWRDSRSITLAVFSIAAVVEVLLDRFAKVARS